MDISIKPKPEAPLMRSGASPHHCLLRVCRKHVCQHDEAGSLPRFKITTFSEAHLQNTFRLGPCQRRVVLKVRAMAVSDKMLVREQPGPKHRFQIPPKQSLHSHGSQKCVELSEFRLYKPRQSNKICITLQHQLQNSSQHNNTTNKSSHLFTHYLQDNFILIHCHNPL